MTRAKEARRRDADRTRGRILEVARREFARSGFDGVSVNDIVAAAKVNKRMVYHYFGDKDGLYREVLARHWLAVKERLDLALATKSGRSREGDSRSGDVRARLVLVLETYFDFVSENQDYVRTLMWEGLQGGAAARSIWTGVRGPLFAQVEFLLKCAQKEGLLKSGLDPAQLVISLLGAITFYFAYASTVVDLVGGDPLSREALRRRREHLTALLGPVLRNES